jgi:hypothetical protein
MHLGPQSMVAGIGVVVGFLAFVVVNQNENQRRKAASKLSEFDDYIDRLALLIDEPVGPSAPQTSVTGSELDELLGTVDAGARRALRLNKAKFISVREELSKAEHTREIRGRVAIGLVGIATLLSLVALLLPA